ncbi:MAG: energy-coupling factor ABC transporter ATP-binding protein [Pseudomonadota bacterium]
MSSLLQIGRLHKAHGARTLYEIADFSLDEATAYVLTGINGSGKTTLLRTLGGLEPAQPTSLLYRGELLQLAPYPARMRAEVLYVHQDPIMFSTSVAHNIGYGLRARGVARERVQALVRAAMDWAGVAQLEQASPASLSGGEKQRVALARAKVLAPKLLLLDEPTANLDGAAREQVIALIPALIEAGSTVVMACHDRDLIGLPGVRRLKLRDGDIAYRYN